MQSLSVAKRAREEQPSAGSRAYGAPADVASGTELSE